MLSETHTKIYIFYISSIRNVVRGSKNKINLRLYAHVFQQRQNNLNHFFSKKKLKISRYPT